ncbi:hypothetical protein C882_1876 [Caenispirillum salinarum AK4]|uniref:DUF302 domain-containing protein n=1 Tax=Caenispirillum salinarum AK4 TaxID=1238182 RepID=K9GRK1_9PROT|nr:DUF302 domain-containing protein [Caenispirillum salinarum]EKV27374.1 hypothetical protein C882_1876 [Caenispirillum salinarum AK4]
MTRLAAALALAAGTALAAVTAATPAAADPAAEGLVVKRSAHSVTETLDRLAQMLTDNGLTVFTRIDHAENAAKADLDLPPTQVLIFGNPKLGTPLMQESRTTAIDLPQKALAWEDADGAVWLAYNHPAWLSERHGLEARQEVPEKIGGALDTFATQASNE